MAGFSSPLVLYDGVCPLCNGFVRFVLRIDRKGVFHFASIQGETAGPILESIPDVGDALDSIVLLFHPRKAEQEAFFKSEAVLRIFQELGGFWRVMAFPARIFSARVRDTIYDWLAGHRYRWFGKYDECPIPPDCWRERFLP